MASCFFSDYPLFLPGLMYSHSFLCHPCDNGLFLLLDAKLTYIQSLPSVSTSSRTWHFKSHMPKAELLTFPHKIARPATFPNKVNGLPIFSAAETKNFESLTSLSQATSELSTNPDSPVFSIYIRNLPLFTMSFAVTLVQATIIPRLHSCSSLLMLPASVITVAGVILLIGRSEHVTLVPSCQWFPFLFREKPKSSQ